MRNVLLICSTGITAGTLVNKMKEEIEQSDLDINVWSVGVAEASVEIKKADIILLSPQASYLAPALKDIVPDEIMIKKIPIELYSEMNGKKVVDIIK